jgi:hypothetical protein
MDGMPRTRRIAGGQAKAAADGNPAPLTGKIASKVIAGADPVVTPIPPGKSPLRHADGSH